MEPLHDARVEATIAAYFEALTRRDKRTWLSLFNADAILHEPVGAMPAEGDEGRQQVWQMLTAPFAELRIQPEDIFYCGTGAALKWRAHARAVAGNNAIIFDGISVFELDGEGRIQTVMSYWDPAEMLIRLADADPDTDS